MKSIIRILLVDDATEILETEKQLLSFHNDFEVVGEAKNGKDAIALVELAKPDIVLMDINMPVMDGIEATRRIAEVAPNTAVIIVSVQEEFQALRGAIQVGAKEYLLKPFTTESLAQSIRTVYHQMERSVRATTTQVLSENFRSRSRVISMLSAKGGVGKSTIAVNVACAMAEKGKKVVLIDLDLFFGDAALLLGYSDLSRNIYTLMLEGDHYLEMVSSYLFTHACGLKVLAAPQQIEQGELISAHYIDDLVKALRASYDYILIDTAPALTDVLFAALETSDETWLVSTADLASIKNNQRLLKALRAVGSEPKLLRHLLVKRGKLSERAVEDVLSLETFSAIDYDPATICGAADVGIPAVLEHRASRAVRDLKHLATKTIAVESRRREPRVKPSRLRFLARGAKG